MATAVSTISAVNRAPLSLNGSGAGAGAAVPSSGFMGTSLKKVTPRFNKVASGSFKVVAAKDVDETKNKDKWAGLAYDISDDQQDIARGKGMVDTLFQAPMGDGTHHAIMNSYDYVSQGLRQFDMDNNMDGFYIAPAFMDKLVVHITKNYMTLPNIKVPLILGIWGGKGQGKSFQCELVMAKMGINPIMMSAGELESGNAGEPAKLIRQRYREAADIIKKGKMCCLFINDLDAGAGRMGGTTQYTVNNQMVNATLMNIADAPTNVQLPGMYNKEENPRVPIIVTGNDFSTLYAPLIRDGRMEKFYWAPTRDDRIGVCKGIFRTDNVPVDDIVKIVDTFPGQSIGGIQLILVNNCKETIWPGILAGAGQETPRDGGFALSCGEQTVLELPERWSGRIWPRQGCCFDQTGKGSCQTGDCSGFLQCRGTGGKPPATLVEMTLGGPTSPLHFYDVSLVDGFNVPVSMVPIGGGVGCGVAACEADLNVCCPAALAVKKDGKVVGCKSACLAAKTDRYCCTGEFGNPKSCKPTIFAHLFKAICPRAYSFAFDDSSSLKTCRAPRYLITFCPPN